MLQKCSVTQSLLVLVGRVSFSLIFLVASYGKIMHFNQYAEEMASKGIDSAAIVLTIAIVFELGGSLLILLGWYARFGALLLFLFIIPVTYVFHSFWELTDAAMMNQMQHFLKNLAMLGGTLYIMACGAGHISIDGFIRKKCCQETHGS